MKTLQTTVLLLIALFSHAQQITTSMNRQIVFEDVNVISMDNEKVMEHQVVVTENGTITGIGTLKKMKYEKDALVIKATGKFLLPGLGEMHAHVPPIDDVEPMKEVLKLFVLNGITTIRGMLGHPKHLELRESIRKGEVMGPHFYTTGPSFSGLSVKSPEEGSAMVKRQKEAGYNYLKFHPGISREKFEAIVSTAKQVGIPFVGHVPFGVGVWRAIEAGYSSIDHLDGFVEGLVPGIEKMVEQQAGLFGMFVADRVDASGIPKLMTALKNSNTWVVPTQALAERWFHPDYSPDDFLKDPHMVYMKPVVVEQWISSKKNLMNNPEYKEDKMKKFVELRRHLILECQKNGVKLLLGCDAPQIFNVPGFSTHEELEYLVRAGLTPYQAIQTGTTNVAKYLNKKKSGIVKEGAVSDLILLNANPLTDITQTRNIAGVMLGNQWMPKEYIDGELTKLKKQ